jgi:hypothetical protein
MKGRGRAVVWCDGGVRSFACFVFSMPFGSSSPLGLDRNVSVANLTGTLWVDVDSNHDTSTDSRPW